MWIEMLYKMWIERSYKIWIEMLFFCRVESEIYKWERLSLSYHKNHAQIRFEMQFKNNRYYKIMEKHETWYRTINSIKEYVVKSNLI